MTHDMVSDDHSNLKTKQQQAMTEAVNAILSFTDDAVNLLKRKKIKREVLLQYLVEQKMRIPEPSDKLTLIMEILKLWKSNADPSQLSKELAADASQSPSASSSSSLTVATTPTPCSNQQQPNGATNFTGQSPITINVHQNYNVINMPAPPTSSHTTAQSDSQGTARANNPEVKQLGEQFAKWFFENLNSHNPTMPSGPKDFKPHHFWDDVKFVVRIHTPNLEEERLIGNALVTERFLKFTRDDQLLFNPNTASGGIHCKSSPHGLVQILVCGTVHRGNECLGIFQQTFGIIQDPRYDNNWKIKVSQLDMKTSHVTEMPKLEGNLEVQINAIMPD